MPEQYTITGVILSTNDAERAGARVQAFDRDMPSLELLAGSSPQLLGDVSTNAEGRFQITYALEQFRAGEGSSLYRTSAEKNADLGFRVFDQRGQELSIKNIEALNRGYGPDQIIFNAPAQLEVNIFVDSPQRSVISEYERLLGLITPIIGNVPLAQLTDEDLLFILNELEAGQQTEIQQRIEWLRRSALLARKTGLPIEAFYGWGRKNVPATFDELAGSDLAHLSAIAEKLFAQTADKLQGILLEAISENIVPAKLRERLAEITAQLERLRVERGFMTARRFVGQLVNEANKQPLAGLVVQGFDLDAADEPKNLGQDVTNSTGVFALVYVVPKTEGNQAQRRLRLEITLDPQTQTKHTTEVRAGADQDILEILVPIPVTEEHANHELNQLADTLQIDLPKELRSFLADKNIASLADIRRAGGSIKGLEGLPVATDHLAVRLLEAHADLSRLSPDVKANAQLIEKHYDSVRAVANATRSDFVNDVHEDVGDFGAAAMHVMASAQNNFLGNVVTGMSVEQANGFKFDELMQADNDSPQQCGCSDCEAAVSPLAYLADLLKYTVQHVKNNNAAITLDTLTDTFHQPFGSLVASCAFESTVRQIRVAVEVLRSYLKDHAPTAAQQGTLDDSERSYRLAAYTLLLPRLGASYEELRLTQTAELKDREAVAQRLGIEEKRLDNLILDPDTLTEKQIEQRFGLVDTTRNPLAAGSTPELQTWRLEYLRTLWKAQDQRTDTPPDTSPIIDPDLIGPADLKNPTAGDPAFDLWQARVTKVADRLAVLEAAPKTLTGFDSILTQTLVVPVSKFLDLAAARKNGDAISKDLDQLNLSSEAFSYLLRVRTLASLAQPILDEEWENVYAILIQVMKRGSAVKWRAAESAADVLLSPDFFQLPPRTTPTFPSPQPTAAQRWRAPADARTAWQDNLETRIDQEQNVIQALSEAVSATEETVLPLLRDALVLATDAPGTDLPSKAEWVTQNLLIDARIDGCALTTRVAQAIETIQGLLTSLRTEQLRSVFKTFTLVADHFDEEWRWLGSYAPWRSAMFVFMYPENLSNPNLRRWRTPGFQDLIRNTQSPRRVTRGTACSAAKEYSTYFRDVCSLRLDASCTSRTRMFRDGDACKAETGYRCLFYMFGRGGISGKVYWSAYDMLDSSGYAQTFWQPIQIAGFENIVEIIGAAPFAISPNQRFIFLFARKQQDTLLNIVCAKYDLENQRWLDEVTPLEVPIKVPMEEGSFSVVMKQQDSETDPPHLAVANLLRRLRADGSGWEDPPFEFYGGFIHGMLSAGQEPFYVVRTRGEEGQAEDVLVIELVTGHPAGRSFFNVSDRHKIISTHSFGTGSRYLGAFTWPERDYVYVVTAAVRGIGSAAGGLIFVTLPLARVWRVRDVGGTSLEVIEVKSPFGFSEPNIAPTAGVVEDATTKSKRLVCQVNGAIAYLDRFLNLSDSGDLFPKQPLPVMPSVSGPFDISGRLSSNDLQLRKALIQKAFTANQAGPASNLAYLEEAYFFVAIQLALGLQRAGEYVAALDWLRTVYDYTAPLVSRKIYHGLVAEASLSEVYKRGQDWLRDPLNPHSIAATRRNTYTRYTLQAIVRCLLDFADSEFTFDTAESNPVARRLYLIALELMDTIELKQHLGDCDDIIGILDDFALGAQWSSNVQRLKLELKDISNPGTLKKVAAEAQLALTQENSPERRFANARAVVSRALTESSPATLRTVLDRDTQANVLAQQSVLQNATLAEAVQVVGRAAANDFQQRVSMVTGASAAQLVSGRKELPWLRQSVVSRNGSIASAASSVRRSDAARLDILAPAHISDLAEVAANKPMVVLSVSGAAQPSFFPSVISTFCIPPNPLLSTLRLRAELNLYKLRTCRNIAGMKRKLDAYAAPTDTVSGLPVIGAGGQLTLRGANVIRPSLYHERVLRDRAKELVQVASQMESALLAALEKGAVERYSMLKARQDLGLAQAGVRLQSLRVTRANHGVKLAELQQDRANIQVKIYAALIAQELNKYELEMLKAYGNIAAAQGDIAGMDAGIQLAQAFTTAATASGPGAPAAAVAAVAVGALASVRAGETENLADAQASAQRLSIYASQERRKEEWLIQQTLAEQDVKIGDQAIALAEDDVDISQQEKDIAELGVSHARDVVEFLNNKFTNAELYESMSFTLEQVYSVFLQQATAVAMVYQNQIAFLRQEAPLGIIKSDYWAAPSDGSGAGGQSDRKGLTGSARLLQDLYQLEQYAFETKKRKLPLTKTISLARLAPAEFQRFRESGVIVFATPMEMFDRDFPGHYLRIISRVRTSVIALIPPNDGIHATLSSSGLSRVVIGPDVFQTVPIRRDPESVALSTPINATGIVEMDAQQSDMLLPFEGCGVDSTWELRMPKAANQFDYSTIADVLVAIEYSTLDSFSYRQQVIQALKPRLSADLAMSFRHHLADQWYDLHNPEQTKTPMTVKFSTVRENFPPNLDALKIQQVLMSFSRGDGKSFEVPVSQLRFTELGAAAPVGGAATSIDGTISTRSGNGGIWAASFIGKTPVGDWELVLPNTEEIRKRFGDEGNDEDIEDILFVITYSGRTPEWPT